MRRRDFLQSVLPLIACGATLSGFVTAQAERPELQTAIIIGDMHCTDCAKKIASRLYSVPGVKGVRAEVKTGIAYVTPQDAKQPSPRALWEAVEQADFTPKKLVGPYGSFSNKPKL